MLTPWVRSAIVASRILSSWSLSRRLKYSIATVASTDSLTKRRSASVCLLGCPCGFKRAPHTAKCVYFIAGNKRQLYIVVSCRQALRVSVVRPILRLAVARDGGFGGYRGQQIRMGRFDRGCRLIHVGNSNFNVLVRRVSLCLQSVEQWIMEDLPPIVITDSRRTSCRRCRLDWLCEGRSDRHRGFGVIGSDHASGKSQGNSTEPKHGSSPAITKVRKS